MRLDRLEVLYQDALKEDVRTLDGRRATRRELLEVLPKAREEVQRTGAGMQTNVLAIQFNHMTDEELRAKRDELLANLRRPTHGAQRDVEVVAVEQGVQTSERVDQSEVRA